MSKHSFHCPDCGACVLNPALQTLSGYCMDCRRTVVGLIVREIKPISKRRKAA